MIRRVFFVLLWFSFFDSSAQELLLTGVYKGKGLYVQNPFDADSNEFCIKSIFVNGKVSDANLRLTAINLSMKEFDLYTPVSIRIVHGDSCKPRIVNPDAILYHTSFKFDSLVVNDSIMHWYTKGDRIEGKYQVEKLDVDRWDVVQEVKAKGRFDGARYVYFPSHDDGGNKYRIRYQLPDGRYLYSAELEYYHYLDEITFSPRVVKDVINLSRAADYEIMDEDGEVILQGSGKSIPLRLLQPGDYSILLEGEVDTFIKK